jgi:4-amino-4-deoxy-L-arabinose transferase-like glycosyltransferase
MPVRTWWLLLALLTALTLLRVASTHRVFSQTYDEPWHVGAGHHYLATGKYQFELQHAPLPRLLFGWPFRNAPIPQTSHAGTYGNVLLFADGEYRDNLALARAGNLLFLAIGIVAVALWARHLFTPAAGLVAALLYASLPPILAHAGLATTDTAIASLLPLSLYAFTLFVEKPTWTRTMLLGTAMGAAALSKYSFVLFFPLCALVIVIARRRFPFARAGVAVLVAVLLVWAGYGFTFGTMAAFDARAEHLAERTIGTTAIAHVPVPAPAFFDGILRVRYHDLKGHPGYLLGRIYPDGVWYYFPAALFFKTPIAFLILAVFGVAVVVRQRRGHEPRTTNDEPRTKWPELVCIAAGILLVVMSSRINIGVRHVLPIYAPLAICAAAAVLELRRWRIASAALIAWLVVGSALAHPDYLAWFNGFARQPERVLSDSNLDWGQDVLRLADTARELRIERMTTMLFGTVPLAHVGLPPVTPLQPGQPVQGWLAISESRIALADPQMRAWLDALLGDREFVRVGKSIRLYRL